MRTEMTYASGVGMGDLLRSLLISALAWALVGCSSASQQTNRRFEDASRGLYRTSQVHSKRRVLHGWTVNAKKTNAPHRKKHNYSNKITETHVVPKMGAPSFTAPDDKSNVVGTIPSPATKTENPPSSHLDDQAKKTEIPPTPQLNDELVIKKAKATIAAKMSDPDSVEFDGIERGRKNARGNSIETVCGFVRDKNGGPKAFLYLVQTDEAYIGGYNIAISDVRNICSGR